MITRAYVRYRCPVANVDLAAAATPETVHVVTVPQTSCECVICKERWQTVVQVQCRACNERHTIWGKDQ